MPDFLTDANTNKNILKTAARDAFKNTYLFLDSLSVFLSNRSYLFSWLFNVHQTKMHCPQWQYYQCWTSFVDIKPILCQRLVFGDLVKCAPCGTGVVRRQLGLLIYLCPETNYHLEVFFLYLSFTSAIDLCICFRVERTPFGICYSNVF